MRLQSEIFKYRAKLADLVTGWENRGMPGREGLEKTALALFSWREKAGIDGIWKDHPPLMVTATLDDGIGQGLQMIHLLAAAMGMPTHYMGLLQTPQSIIETCRTLKSEFLGLTVLQFDSEEAIIKIAAGLDSNTCIIAGGPVFKIDPEFADRAGISVVAGNAAEFVDFCLKIQDHRL